MNRPGAEWGNICFFFSFCHEGMSGWIKEKTSIKLKRKKKKNLIAELKMRGEFATSLFGKGKSVLGLQKQPRCTLGACAQAA